MKEGKPYRHFFHSLRNSVLLSALALPISSVAQDIINQTNLYVPTGLELHVDGDFANEGFVQNQGNFFVSGNWKNANVYQGVGTIILNGTGAQSFFSNKNPVDHLVIDGTGPIRINDLLPITSQLDLLNGIVVVTDADTLSMAQGASVSGGSPESHVDGEFTYAGTGYKFFPIGKNGNYNPVEMLDITGINPVTSVEVFENLPAIQSPPLITLYQKIYWERKTIAGTFTNSPIAIGFQIPDNYTNRHVIEIVEGEDLGAVFSALRGVSVSYDPVLDKVISDDGLTKNVFVIGESTPSGGIPGEFYFSTSLSPQASNPDNRAIKIFGDQLIDDSFHFLVYNRWGKIVFETTSLGNMILSGWDGRSQNGGDLLPSGAYPYLLQAVTKTGTFFEKKGIISIIN